MIFDAEILLFFIKNTKVLSIYRLSIHTNGRKSEKNVLFFRKRLIFAVIRDILYKYFVKNITIDAVLLTKPAAVFASFQFYDRAYNERID